MIEHRIRFYVVHATAEENEMGRYHHLPFPSLQEAERVAEETIDDFVAIEKRHERRDPPPTGFVYRKPEDNWDIDYESGGIETIRVV